ncbi:MAG: hypothetical protein LBD99_01910 [Candidatus Margulisbacteria bacterium]|nr:hypothetical protein [Candidatus Margulisiibacteriota bacterium]
MFSKKVGYADSDVRAETAGAADLKQAAQIYKGPLGWYSIREIISLETQLIREIFDGPQLGSTVRSVARYSFGRYGWKNYVTNNMHELNAEKRRDADAGSEYEKPFELFAGVDAASKNKKIGEIVCSEEDGTLRWYQSPNSNLRFMEIQSRRNREQRLLFVVRGTIPHPDGDKSAEQEEAVLLLRLDKPLALESSLDKLRRIEEICALSDLAYKERMLSGRIEIDLQKPLPIHQAAYGRVWVAEEETEDWGVEQVPDADKQPSLVRLSGAVKDAFARLAELRLNGIAEYLQPGASVEDCLQVLRGALDRPENKDSLEDMLKQFFTPDFQKNLTALAALLFYFKQTADILKKLQGDTSGQSAFDILYEMSRKFLPTSLGSGNIRRYQEEHLRLTRRILKGIEEQSIPPGSIIVGASVSDTALHNYKQAGASGIVSLNTEDTYHSVIDAKALQYPFCIGLDKTFLKYIDRQDHDRPADRIVFYGRKLIINPSEDEVNALRNICANDGADYFIEKFKKFKSEKIFRGERLLSTLEINFIPGVIRRGFSLLMGLFRMEFIRGKKNAIPDFAEWLEIIRQTVRDYPGGVTFRTLDVGRDKGPESIGLPEMPEGQSLRDYIEAHPEAQKAIYEYMRAIFAVASEQPETTFKIMYPMVRSPDDVAYYHNTFFKPLSAQFPAARVQKGVMIETPSAVFSLEAIMSAVDFVSIGTNDLTMSILNKTERQAAVSGLEPGVLNAIRFVINRANRAGKPVKVCGDMASNPLLACILLSLDAVDLSMEENSVPVVSAVARYAVENNLLPEIARIISAANAADNFAKTIYHQVMALFSKNKRIYNYLQEYYFLPA